MKNALAVLTTGTAEASTKRYAAHGIGVTSSTIRLPASLSTRLSAKAFCRVSQKGASETPWRLYETAPFSRRMVRSDMRESRPSRSTN